MFKSRQTRAEVRAPGSTHRRRGVRWIGMVAACAAAWSLSACGGGGYADSAGNFNIGVTVGGQFVSDTPVASGGSLSLAVYAGQSVILDAGEPVVWTLYVDGSAFSGDARVYYAGADIWATPLSRSRIAVDTAAEFSLLAAVPITLVATSTYDAAQVATVNLLITN